MNKEIAFDTSKEEQEHILTITTKKAINGEHSLGLSITQSDDTGIYEGLIVKGMSRKEAIRDAIANAELEGYLLTRKQKEVFKKLANGELSYEDVDKIIEKEIENLRKTRPEAFAE